MKPPARLLADVGGTNIRLAWQERAGGGIQNVRIFPTAGFAGIEDALRHYLREIGQDAPQEAAIAIANPILGDWIEMTNHPWAFSISALQTALGLARLEVINDFTALALALPDIGPGELRQVGGASPPAGAHVAVVGPGTGLGVSGLFFDPELGKPLFISGEGGHVTLAAETDLEWRVIEWLSRRYGHASAERAVSGPGLVNLHYALRECGHAAGRDVRSPAEVTELALIARDPLAVAALEMFCAFLGSIAGNLALTLGARGGVYIAGGIVPRLCPWFLNSPFRVRFESKGRFRAYLAAIPCWVIEASAGGRRASRLAIGRHRQDRRTGRQSLRCESQPCGLRHVDMNFACGPQKLNQTQDDTRSYSWWRPPNIDLTCRRSNPLSWCRPRSQAHSRRLED